MEQGVLVQFWQYKQQNENIWLGPASFCIQLGLCQLHWLSIEFQICFKVLVLTFKVTSGQGLAYFQNCLFPYTTCRALWSANQHLLVIRSPKDI